MSEENPNKMSEQELDEMFSFDNKTLDDYEDDATIDKGEYDLEVESFNRGVKEITEENAKEGQTIGEKIPYCSFKLRHAKDKNGNIDPSLMGRRYELFFWDLRKETVRDDVGQIYRNFGYDGAYVPQYKESEFIQKSSAGTVTRARGTFYIGLYEDSQTKRKKNSRPKVIDNSKSKAQAKKDAASGNVEL